ncbi:hypothetical protein BDW72DRAFT_82198 [Aspergillus terricola var. indicus]
MHQMSQSRSWSTCQQHSIAGIRLYGHELTDLFTVFSILSVVIIACLALYVEGMGLASLFGVNGDMFSRRDDYEAPRMF